MGRLDRESRRSATAYNLCVDGIHTYFIRIDDESILVHNVCPEIIEYGSGLSSHAVALRKHFSIPIDR